LEKCRARAYTYNPRDFSRPGPSIPGRAALPSWASRRWPIWEAWQLRLVPTLTWSALLLLLPLLRPASARSEYRRGLPAAAGGAFLLFQHGFHHESLFIFATVLSDRSAGAS